MNTMAGAWALACSNRSRTRLAPTPTNISTKSEPEIEKNGTPASPATARASSVLPVPGGPEQQHALGDLGPDRAELLGVLQELLDLLQLLDGFVDAGHVVEGDLGLVLGDLLGLRLAELHHPAAAALGLHDDEDHESEDQDPRQQPDQELQDGGAFLVDVEVDAGLLEPLVEVGFGLIGVGGLEIELSVDRLLEGSPATFDSARMVTSSMFPLSICLRSSVYLTSAGALALDMID